jgi:hypothetical protein
MWRLPRILLLLAAAWLVVSVSGLVTAGPRPATVLAWVR